MTRPLPRRRSHGVALLVLGTLLLTACGTNVSDPVRRKLADAALNPAAGGAAAASGDGGGAVAGDGTGAAVPGTTGAQGPAQPGAAAATAGPAGGGGGGGAAVAAPAPAGGNGGATDIGVTATTITLGHVSDLSGPQPGLFQTAVNGTNAYIAYVNSQGGLYGRKLKIAVSDAQTSCEGDRSGHQALVGKVFAFAGSFSLFDSCGATVLAANPGVPDAHLAVTPEANKLANNYSVNPIGDKIGNGSYAWFAKKFGPDVVSHAAIMYANLPAVNNVAGIMKRSAESTGWKFDYERAVGATETDFTADIIQMRQKGIKMFLTLFNADEMANFKPQADQQSFKPVIDAPLLYDQSFMKKLGSASAAEGIYGVNSAALFFSAEDARNVPSVALFQKFYAKVSGGGPADSFAVDGWAETALLVKAMRAVGPKLTRKAVLAELAKVTRYDADGMFSPANPAGKVPGICYIIWQIKNGKYVRIETPPTGFRCDGRPA